MMRSRTVSYLAPGDVLFAREITNVHETPKDNPYVLSDLSKDTDNSIFWNEHRLLQLEILMQFENVNIFVIAQ